MVKTGKTPSQLIKYLFSKVGPHYYDRIDIDFPAAERQKTVDRAKAYRPTDINSIKVDKIDTADGFRFILADTGWLLIRFSGTEPLLRIYAESNSTERVRQLLAAGRAVVGV